MEKKIPQHIVLFPDGNRRWAKDHNISVQEGYLKGKDKFNEFLYWCKDKGVKVVTVFGFSSENWKRPQDQVGFLMGIFEKFLAEKTDEFNQQQVRVKIIGQRDKLSQNLRNVIENVEKSTENNHAMQLNLAVSYGGKWDIINAFKKIIEEKVPVEKIDEALVANYLSTAGLPEPDLVIRAGGEMRLSNFVLWQSAYAELYFSEKMWPDFSKEDFDKAIEGFGARARRFGK